MKIIFLRALEKKKNSEMADQSTPTLQNLNVTGTLRVSGRQVVIKRLYAKFTRAENTSPAVATGATPASGARTGIAPARLFDYETGAPFEVPATAGIRGFTVVGTSDDDQDLLKDLRAWAQVPKGSATGIGCVALSVTRCPVPKDGVTDTVASRDPTKELTVVTVDLPALPDAVALTKGTDPLVQTRNTSDFDYVYASGNANPYHNYYRNLSTNAAGLRGVVNSHVGICCEYADVLLARTPSGARFDWVSPAASNGLSVASVLAANPGLAISFSFVRASGNAVFSTSTQTEVMQAGLAIDLKVDVLIELEYNEDATTQKRDVFATSRIAEFA